MPGVCTLGRCTYSVRLPSNLEKNYGCRWRESVAAVYVLLIYISVIALKYDSHVNTTCTYYLVYIFVLNDYESV